MGWSPSEILLEVHVHLADVRTDSALLKAASGNILLQERDRPSEGTGVDGEIRAPCVEDRCSLGVQSPALANAFFASARGPFLVRSRKHVFHPLHVVTLCSLTDRVLELHCLGEIGVPQQVVLSTQFISSCILLMSCNTTLPPSWRIIVIPANG